MSKKLRPKGYRATPTAPEERGRPVRWTRRAEADLDAIYEYIAEDDPAATGRWVEKLLEQAEKAGLLPFSGRRVPEFGREEVRELLLRSYRIVYRVTEREVQLLTIFEGHRRLPLDAEDVP